MASIVSALLSPAIADLTATFVGRFCSAETRSDDTADLRDWSPRAT